MSQVITLNVRDKIASCITEKPVVCGNSDYEIHFNFDEEWNGHEIKTAVFTVNGKSVLRPFSGTVCKIPELNNTLILWVGVFAGTIDDGTLSTSTPALVHCVPCATDGEHLPFPPPDDVYNQIVELCDEAVSTATDVKERADNGEFNGKDGADGKTAHQYAVDGGYEGSEEDFARDTANLTIAKESAEQAASNASTSEQNASTSEQNAIASAESAQESADRANAILEDVAKEADTSKKYANNVFANALKGYKSGQSVSADNVSPIEHELDVKVSSKNILPNSYIGKTINSYGITVVGNADGSFTASGTNTKTDAAFLYISVIPHVNGDYFISEEDAMYSGSPRGYGIGAENGLKMLLETILPNGNPAYNPCPTEATPTYTTGKIPKGSTIRRLYLMIPKGYTFETPITFHPQLEYGTVATEFTYPSMDVEGTIVKQYGKNLFKTSNYSKGSLSNGEISEYQKFAITSDYIFLPKGTYIISYVKGAVGVDGAHLRNVAVYDKEKNHIASESLWSTRVNNYKFTLAGDRYVRIDLEKSAPDGKLGSNSYPIENYDTFFADYKVQLELGTTATEYEPYRKPVEVIVDAEGNVEGLMSLAPNMTLIGESGTTIDCTYNRDINKAFEEITQALVSLGANI